ncbi:MAG: hypothetical protein AAGA42_08765 [Actinomycetota bacterium]
MTVEQRRLIRRRAAEYRRSRTQNAVHTPADSLDGFTASIAGGGASSAVLSLDVFDTVVTRSCGQPADLFLWLGRRLRRAGVVDCDAVVFAEVRARAEQAVWVREGHLDSRAGLEDFYREVVARLGIDQRLIPELVAAELDLEREVSHLIPAARRLLDAYPAEAPLAFTSDAYFTAEFVDELLRSHVELPPNTQFVVSSATDASKAEGGLFDHIRVADRNGAIVHLGDHPHSDLRVPLQLGIDARWVQEGRLNRFERRLAADASATAGFSSALAGASRIARLETVVSSGHEDAIRRVAAGVAAPTLVGFVLWLLMRAQRLGLRRLVFLARDGQVMRDLATRLIERLGLDIEARYLAVSRRSTNLAATFELDEEEVGWVFRDLDEMSINDVLRRFDLEWTDVADAFAATAVAGGHIAARPHEGAIRAVLADARVRSTVLARATTRRERVLRFFDAEGLLDDVACGIVDFGGVGSQVRAVHALFSSTGVSAPRIFVFGLDDPEQAGLPRPATDPAWLDDAECYLYDHRRRRGIRRARGFGTCVQMFCAADHGTVVDYREHGDDVVPVLASERDEPVLDWGLHTFRDTVLSFVDALVLDCDLVDPYADVRDVCCAVIESFWSDPDRAEAAAWGAFPLEGAQAAGSHGAALAHRYTWRGVGADLVRGEFPDLGWMHWYEGSLALSSPVLGAVVSSAERAYRRVDQRQSRSATLIATTIKTITGR